MTKSNPLPVSLADLLKGQKVESDRIEFKAGWNPPAIFRTICAFANDFHNYGGGYVVVGVADDADGLPVLPPAGVPNAELDRMQRELLQYGNLIQPPYFPILGFEEVEGRTVAMLWCPGGQSRPYKVPKDVTAKDKEYQYYIRRYANSVQAKDAELRELIELTATVPYDDRVNHHATLDDLQLPLLRSYLKRAGSGLHAPASKMPFADLCRRMAIADGSDEFLKPRNVGLLFFHDDPEKFFPTARIEVVRFPDGPAGDRLDERVFRGPLDAQLRAALQHLRGEVIAERVTKVAGRAEAVRVFNYPFAAVEEAVVNAVYHRGYDVREPIEVRVNPGSIEVHSYPGPDPSIRPESLRGERILSRRYRNRRIGEFLKELDLAEGRFTGIPKMREAMRANGSPEPQFVTDNGRTFFCVELPIHPAFRITEVHEEVQVEVHDAASLTDTELRILRVLRRGARAVSDIARELGYDKLTGNVRVALARLDELGYIALTIPDRPRSKQQKRQLTATGRAALRRAGRKRSS